MQKNSRKTSNNGNYFKFIRPPKDPLIAAIPQEVRNRWRNKPTEILIRRLDILNACGPYPSDHKGRCRLMHYRAIRSAWETYIYSAFACGLFEGERGKELRGRFASRDANDFRSAISECLTCWFLAAHLGLPVNGEMPGQNSKILDMRTVINNDNVGVEVKSPYRTTSPHDEVICGHDADLLACCLQEANKQFNKDIPNILIIVPELRFPVFSLRLQLITALYGQEVITCKVDKKTGAMAGPTEIKFNPDGKFLKKHLDSGKLIKRNGRPPFTRISAVVVIEERIREHKPIWWIDHDVLIAHNPNANYPINPKTFNGYIQFKDLGGGYGWSDGKPLES